jgi:hypothetical protein
MLFLKPTAAGSNNGNQCREDKCGNQRMEHFRNMLHSQNPSGFNLRNDVITFGRYRLLLCTALSM